MAGLGRTDGIGPADREQIRDENIGVACAAGSDPMAGTAMVVDLDLSLAARG
jgi:hypothetical protein